MKAFIALLAVLAIAHAHLSADDHLLRQKIIAQVNSNPASTWHAGVNPRFDGASYDYVKSLCGSLEDKGQSNLPIEDPTVDVSAIPTAFDSRTQWGAQCPSMSEVRDQSNCGSCWAHGTAEAATDRFCITKGTNLHLSAEDINSCCKSCGSGCNGGYPSAAWAWAVSTGVVTGGNYGDFTWCSEYELPNCDHHTTGQYIPCTSLPSYPTPTCHSACDSNSTYKVSYTSDKRKASKSYGVSSSVSAIQTEVMTNGPVTASFSVYEDFESYTSGVYVHTTGSYLGGHSVKIIGWGVEGSTPYWTVANSWNQDWGEKGFFRILRGVNECGIEGSIVCGVY